MYLTNDEIVVPLSDLRYMVLECTVCHTEVVLDMAHKVDQPSDPMPHFLTPKQCPFCRAPFDSPEVDGFRSVFQNASTHQTKMSFRMKAECMHLSGRSKS